MDDDVLLVDMPVYQGGNGASTSSNNEEDRQPQRLPVVPPPRSNDDLMLDLDEEDANAPALAEIEDVPMAASKKSRKATNRNLGKMDATRLLGTRGLPALEGYFKGVEFKGNGHEAENLNLLMSKLEHWAHNMCPKLCFEDTLDKIESLGQKREVKTYMKKYRMGFDDDDERPPEESDNNSISDADRQQRTSHNTPMFVDIYASHSPDAEAAGTSNDLRDGNASDEDNNEERNQDQAEPSLPSLTADEVDTDGEEAVVLEDTDGRDGSVPSGFIPFNQAVVE